MSDTPNALERYCSRTGADPAAVLTWLQTRFPDTPVSDLCQSIADVDSGDAERAVERILKAKKATIDILPGLKARGFREIRTC